MPPARETIPRTVFTHFYQGVFRRDHTSWPITGFEDCPDPKAEHYDPNLYWWKQEMEYVARAKIDVLTFMFWAPNGVDQGGGRPPWQRFLEVARLRSLEGQYVPKICCHYDGMGFGDLRGIDVGTEAGIATVFHHMAQWYDYWTQPGRRDHLFTFRGADVCLMYRPEALGKVACPAGGRFVDELHRRFAERYPGRRLYLVLDELWVRTYATNELHADNADNYYFWGSSFHGPTVPKIATEFGIRSIGPGFGDIGHNQSDTPDSEIGRRGRDWRGGQTFRDDWQVALDTRAENPWLLLETWNLFLERSEVTVSNKWGDTCVNLCAENVPKFKA